MAHVGDEKVGAPSEFELRDDDRPADTAYWRGRRTSFGAILLLGLLVIAALASVAYDRPPGGSLTGAPAVTGTP